MPEGHIGDDYFWMRARDGHGDMTELAFGAPFLSLRRVESQFGMSEPLFRYSFDVTVPAVGHVRLPTCPVWPGFALNTIFYAALIGGAWGVWQVPLAIRRRRRRARGECVRCGYALAGLPPGSPCPECGPSTKSG